MNGQQNCYLCRVFCCNLVGSLDHPLILVLTVHFYFQILWRSIHYHAHPVESNLNRFSFFSTQVFSSQSLTYFHHYPRDPLSLKLLVRLLVSYQ